MDSGEIVELERRMWREEQLARRRRDFPYRAELQMDARLWHHFQRTSQDDPNMTIIEIHRTTPDVWTVVVGCSTEELARRFRQAY